MNIQHGVAGLGLQQPEVPGAACFFPINAPEGLGRRQTGGGEGLGRRLCNIRWDFDCPARTLENSESFEWFGFPWFPMGRRSGYVFREIWSRGSKNRTPSYFNRTKEIIQEILVLFLRPRPPSKRPSVLATTFSSSTPVPVFNTTPWKTRPTPPPVSGGV